MVDLHWIESSYRRSVNAIVVRGNSSAKTAVTASVGVGQQCGAYLPGAELGYTDLRHQPVEGTLEGDPRLNIGMLAKQVQQSSSVDEFDGFILCEVIRIGSVTTRAHKDSLIGPFIDHRAV